MGKRLRVRDLGLKIGSMETGAHNTITDVKGVGVGHTTLVRGEGPLKVGEGPVRAGVTAIVPHQGNPFEQKIVSAVDIFNAYGKSVGLPQVIHMGVLETPILLTDTLNTWIAADALVSYMHERYLVQSVSMNPVVGETNGGFLNDSMGRHVRKPQVFEAIDKARSIQGGELVEEGNVGGGTPMSGFGFKGGIGTSSRKNEYFTLGVLVQLNCGRREDLRIDGVPVGKELVEPVPKGTESGNSIMMIFATDLGLDSRQLWKVAKRVVWGVARAGHYGGTGSGDFTIGFTTGEKSVQDLQDRLRRLGGENARAAENDGYLNPVFRAAIEATEEAVLNALFKAETMTGRDGNMREALPIDRVKEILEKYNRL